MEWVSYICLCCDQDWDGDGDDGGYDDGWMDGSSSSYFNQFRCEEMEDGRWQMEDMS